MNELPQQDPRLAAVVADLPYPLVFATISGAHLYGFPSPDSDYDLRGMHVLPLRQVVGLLPTEETIERAQIVDGLELDLVTHDLLKFARLLLTRNGYVLEQLFSPLVVATTSAHEELRAIAAGCITRYHAHHYLGFARTQWVLFEKERPRRIKPLLYTYRVLLTGLHLMRTGKVEANLVRLNAEIRLAHVDELIRAKMEAKEQATLADGDLAFHAGEYQRLVGALAEARDSSTLREAPATRRELNEWVVRTRLAQSV